MACSACFAASVLACQVKAGTLIQAHLADIDDGSRTRYVAVADYHSSKVSSVSMCENRKRGMLAIVKSV